METGLGYDWAIWTLIVTLLGIVVGQSWTVTETDWDVESLGLS